MTAPSAAPWLLVDGASDGCALALVRPGVPAPLAALPHWTLERLAQVSSIERPLSIPGIASAPTSNMQAQLDNADGQLSQLWGERAPMRRPARLFWGEQLLFDGIITAVQLGAQLRLELEAGMARPLSDNVPLRTSAVWGGWREVQVLPWVWGRCTLTPIQYSDDRRLFVLADHPIEAVDEVLRDDVATSAFAWHNGVDSTGQALAFLELALPLAEGERLAVRLRGRMHPQTGRLLQSPAEILFDLLANLARAPLQWSDLDDFRTECQQWVLGGLLNDNSISIRAAVDGLLQSCAGAWSAAMPGVAFAWPPEPDPLAPALRVDALSATDLQASTQATGLCTSLRVLYDYDHAAQRYRRALQLQASEALKEYGLLEQEWPAPWLRTPRQAELLGQRVLSWLARVRWRITWQQAFADVATGSWVELAHPLCPVAGRHRLVSAQLDLGSARLSCTVEAAVGPAPRIETVRLSSAFEPLIEPGITLELANGEIIFTARDEQGRPLAGAKITLDGAAQRLADAQGRVAFPAARGRHVLRIEAQGYPPSEAEVLV